VQHTKCSVVCLTSFFAAKKGLAGQPAYLFCTGAASTVSEAVDLLTAFSFELVGHHAKMTSPCRLHFIPVGTKMELATTPTPFWAAPNVRLSKPHSSKPLAILRVAVQAGAGRVLRDRFSCLIFSASVVLSPQHLNAITSPSNPPPTLSDLLDVSGVMVCFLPVRLSTHWDYEGFAVSCRCM